MTEHIEGFSRGQILLLPDRLDDYVGEQNEVRFIDAFVGNLDLNVLGFRRVEPSETGRPSYDPYDLLKLFVWGYLNGIRSSRKLERECNRCLEAIWLMRKLAPDFWTISEFRKENPDRITGDFREFVAFLQDIDLVEGKFVSIDGSKFRACNSRKRTFTRNDDVEPRLKRIEERVDRYMRELEMNDQLEEEEDEDDGELLRKKNDYLRAKLERLKKSKRDLEEARRKLQEDGVKEVSFTDPDSKLMKNNGRFEVCYNAEMAVDRKGHMIVNYDVTNDSNDQRQLSPMARSTKEALGVQKLEVAADSGFANMAQIRECVEDGITPYLPTERLDGSTKGRGGGNVPDPVNFGKDKFPYDRKRDVYTCPTGNEMTFRHTVTRKDGEAWRVYATDACKACPFRAKCTKSKRGGRTITRWVDQKIIDQLLERVKKKPETLDDRAKLAEHPFGTIKRAFGMRYFLLRGLRKVNAEMGFTVLAYDMRRALNILGTLRLIEAL